MYLYDVKQKSRGSETTMKSGRKNRLWGSILVSFTEYTSETPPFILDLF